MHTDAVSHIDKLDAERLVSDRELAKQLSVSRRHVHSLRTRGVLRAVKIGASLRFPLHENLARILDAGK